MIKKELFNTKNYVIMCPPVSQYTIPPADQPGCEEIICEYCDLPMWISKKKRNMKSYLNESILIACYFCIKRFALDNPEVFKDSIRKEL